MDELNQKILQIGQIHELQSNYEKTLLLLSAIKSGQIDIEDFVLTEGGWQLRMPPAFVPESPVDVAPIDVSPAESISIPGE